MKKTIYAALAALVLTIGFTSCKDKVEKTLNDAIDSAVEEISSDAGTLNMTPEEKALASFEDLLTFMKSIKVNSVEDIAKSNEELENFKTELENKYGKDFLDGDFSTFHFSDDQLQRIQELQTELSVEALRLANEQAQFLK